MSTRLLEGERALVTGCAGGIGRGIAKALLTEGATVLGSDIVAPPAEDGIDFLVGDLGERDGWKQLLDGAVARLGTISLFVHAASPRRLEADTPLDLSSGYIQRGLAIQPKNAKEKPWRLNQDYLFDRKYLKENPLDEGIERNR